MRQRLYSVINWIKRGVYKRSIHSNRDPHFGIPDFSAESFRENQGTTGEVGENLPDAFPRRGRKTPPSARCTTASGHSALPPKSKRSFIAARDKKKVIPATEEKHKVQDAKDPSSSNQSKKKHNNYGRKLWKNIDMSSSRSWSRRKRRYKHTEEDEMLDDLEAEELSSEANAKSEPKQSVSITQDPHHCFKGATLKPWMTNKHQGLVLNFSGSPEKNKHVRLPLVLNLRNGKVNSSESSRSKEAQESFSKPDDLGADGKKSPERRGSAKKSILPLEDEAGEKDKLLHCDHQQEQEKPNGNDQHVHHGNMMMMNKEKEPETETPMQNSPGLSKTYPLKKKRPVSVTFRQCPPQQPQLRPKSAIVGDRAMLSQTQPQCVGTLPLRKESQVGNYRKFKSAQAPPTCAPLRRRTAPTALPGGQKKDPMDKFRYKKFSSVKRPESAAIQQNEAEDLKQKVEMELKRQRERDEQNQNQGENVGSSWIDAFNWKGESAYYGSRPKTRKARARQNFHQKIKKEKERRRQYEDKQIQAKIQRAR